MHTYYIHIYSNACKWDLLLNNIPISYNSKSTVVNTTLGCNQYLLKAVMQSLQIKVSSTNNDNYLDKFTSFRINISKINKQYTNTNPAFLTEEAALYLHQQNINHLLIDLPSIDREVDDGKLLAHHAFWQYPLNTQIQRTVTEMIYVPNHIFDGTYILNLQIASFENDASPSKPVLYILNKMLTQ